MLPAVKDGGVIGSVRGWSGRAGARHHRQPDRWSTTRRRRADLLERLEQQLADGVYTLRVAKVLPAEQAEQAHRELEAGGVRGRIVLDFS